MVFSQSEMLKSGRMVGPRVYSTGNILYGADGDFKAVVNSIDDARSALRRTKAFGAFSVKSYNQPRREQRQMVIQAARELGMEVVPEGGSFFYHDLTMILDGHTTVEHNLPVAPNLLKRNFSTEKPNQVWASDITYIWTKEGWLFLAVIVDLFSRQIVGWSIDKTMTRELVLTALRQACFQRKPGTGLIFHSDRGSQYCSREFRQALRDWHMLQSQSRKGDCWDNAVAESFFHTLKTEAIFHEIFETRTQAERFVFEWIEAFYNRERLHSTLGYMSPVAFEVVTCA